MILSFKQTFPWRKPTNFKEKILAGTKIHSIRPKGRWKPGMKIHMAYGVRTKNYDCFCDTEKCISKQNISIVYYKVFGIPSIEIFIDGKIFYRRDSFSQLDNGMIELAKNDGFDSVDDFLKWFDITFYGQIIHWTDFRY